MEEMLVVKRGYDFSKWLLNHTGKFPKSYRFSVATKIENAILDFIEMTSVANTRRDKLPLLKRADEALVRLRLLLRLSYEMRFLNLKYGSTVGCATLLHTQHRKDCGVRKPHPRVQITEFAHPTSAY